MRRYLVCDTSKPGRVVEARDGEAALAALGYPGDTKEAAVFDLASDRELAAIDDALADARDEADEHGEEHRLEKIAELAATVEQARAGAVPALRQCIYLYDEMRDARFSEEAWP